MDETYNILEVRHSVDTRGVSAQAFGLTLQVALA